MSRIGFWQLLLDKRISPWEAEKINAASDAAEIAQSHAADAHFSLRQLASRLESQAREIVMLRTAVTVLTRTLADAKLLDVGALDHTLDEAMEAAYPTPPDPDVVAAPSTEAPNTRRYTCIRCRQEVLASTTSMTADGPACDRCPTQPAPYR